MGDAHYPLFRYVQSAHRDSVLICSIVVLAHSSVLAFLSYINSYMKLNYHKLCLHCSPIAVYAMSNGMAEDCGLDGATFAIGPPSAIGKAGIL